MAHEIPRIATGSFLSRCFQRIGEFSGKVARLERLEAACDVLVEGWPGIGKSRLIAELWSVVEADPDFIHWRQGRSLPYGDGVTFWALAEMVKAQAGILETDSLDEAVSGAVGQPRFNALLLWAFATVALVLSGIAPRNARGSCGCLETHE